MSATDPMITNVPGMPVLEAQKPIPLPEFKGDSSQNAPKDVGAVAVGEKPELITPVPGMENPEAPKQ